MAAPEPATVPEPVTVLESTTVQEHLHDIPTSSSDLSSQPTSPCGSESGDSPASSMLSELTFSEPSSPDVDAVVGPESCPSTPCLMTYRFVGDNIDKNVKPRNMTSDNQTRSLHYFHTYAVKDRVDLSSFSSNPPAIDVSNINLETLLPSSEDDKVLRENLEILIGRTLRKNIPFFADFAVGIEKHIKHEFYDQMSRKSKVVRMTCICILTSVNLYY